jgi:Bacterial antitoxin of type II TA system, VapB
MLINLAIDDSLIEEACQLSDQLTALEVATLALQEYVKRRKQLKLLGFFCTVEYHDNYNPKEQRNFNA